MKRVDTIKLKKLIKIGIKKSQTDYNSIKKHKTKQNKKRLKK